VKANLLKETSWFKKLTVKDLLAEDIICLTLPVEDYRAPLEQLKTERGYVSEDVVELNPQTPDLTALLEKFSREHLHTEDEVRYVLEGEGIFDIRSKEDFLMRVCVEANDLIVIPANRYHRFKLASERIKTIRLFKNTDGWTPVFRESGTPV
jgi:1,2-dihydroxy-3-keto-5-methylthiopentene dioxygenase